MNITSMLSMPTLNILTGIFLHITKMYEPKAMVSNTGITQPWPIISMPESTTDRNTLQRMAFGRLCR